MLVLFSCCSLSVVAILFVIEDLYTYLLVDTAILTKSIIIIIISEPKDFYKLSHARMFSRPKILFLVSLLFVALLNSIPTYLLNFKFFIILVCLLFIHAKHS